MMGPALAAEPVRLTGSAYERGRQQAEIFPELIDAVRQAVLGRLALISETLARPAIQSYLQRQWKFSQRHAKDCCQELLGIAAGFSLRPEDLLAYLHLSVIQDLARKGPHDDGCSAWAISLLDAGVLGKNRDFHSEHAALQQVFWHSDPAWKGRTILTVGSLGSPGAYSSGINSCGLAVADTQIGTSDHGVGLLRYFLMSVLLVTCRTVDDALNIIGQSQHVGGGSLVLADAAGAVAAVELGHRHVHLKQEGGSWRCRTNHFVSAELSATQQGLPEAVMDKSSRARLNFLTEKLPGLSADFHLSRAKAMMASHDTSERSGLCRHGEDGDAFTISTSLYCCNPPTLDFCAGVPCSGNWRRYVV
jgi:hypothetical protein